MPTGKMLINYVPGEECRIAITDADQLEEYHAEPSNAVSRVGNIYVGRVTNVEPGIQAAFVDFGVEEAGFLHVSDLHPQYFPGEDEDTTERVGKKTPRRDRPPMQHALKRGQEVVVQVLKEGIGTKGPTLTSYLSIPGRFLVMMPNMDRVGVSRKVEDEDARQEMRKILDTLDLPEGFGFILRTAGFNRTKIELKRDLSYLSRLWKDMERRLAQGKAPRLLYSESDLLVRSLRDLLSQDIDEVIIDNEMALRRAARFMKIVAPRSQARLRHYKGRTPIFHAFGITEQIRQIHAREVPLPSGGRLVIDETEALVAIDVNSGKMRSARDAETNAYKVNVEAVDAICRQLRLRDLGGLVINDLIDMRIAKHRKDIENRFRERLKRDRARSTTLPISSFGILEMTRQRMRGSHESVHFAACQSCRGRGVVQKPDSVAADSLQDLAALLDHDRVAKVEMVVNPRVAGALLSTRRAALTRIEHLAGKSVEVRISDAIPFDRVTFYAYEANGADIDLEKLPAGSRKPELVDWIDDSAPETEGWAVDLRAEAEEVAEQTAEAFAEAQAVIEEMQHEALPSLLEDEELQAETRETQPISEPERKKRRRRRRRRGGGEGETQTSTTNLHPPADARPDTSPETLDAHPSAVAQSAATAPGGDQTPPAGKKKRRRRRRRGRGDSTSTTGSSTSDCTHPVETADQFGLSGEGSESAESAPAETVEAPESDESASSETSSQPARKKRRRRRGKPSVDQGDRPEQAEPAAPPSPRAEPRSAPDRAPESESESAPKPRSRRRDRKPDARPDSGPGAAPPPPAAPVAPVPEPKPRRSLYSAGRRKLNPSERGRIAED
ncbi:MAG: Rne/Rng family ribonuclease [Leptolyngbya sp. PLA3]|nr:MAG: Rne/Rng family ribonuclease [Cyanobacteria bacterium CYA]MCE7967441.1 Rne/Rng family ribonuclease [Leptolyngbya sp. PL-A3]